MSQQMQEPFKRVSVAEAKELIARGVQVVDVRTPAEYAQGHIPEAKLIPLDSILARPQDLLKGDNILFVCQVGQRSALAAEMAAAVGFKQLYNLDGGTDAWLKDGQPVAT
ncbi:MAG TPA: rhodanese-like domain-containing protein [Chloroflexota bacterium]|nr:rhodanese-like domain-containing protein [Chloroflexota bacterium]